MFSEHEKKLIVEMLPASILIKECWFVLLPECRMLLFKSFEDGLHNGGPEEFRLIFYPVPVAVYAQRLQLPVVQHKGKPVGSLQPLFFVYNPSYVHAGSFGKLN